MLNENSIIKLNTEVKSPRRFVFVLIENFTLLSFSSALDALRIANRMSGKKLYDWIFIGENEEFVSCSAGTQFKLDNSLIELHRDDTILLCGGTSIQESTTRKLIGWLRREARRGLIIGGLCTAAYPMAKAGLLDEKKLPFIGKIKIVLQKNFWKSN